MISTMHHTKRRLLSLQTKAHFNATKDCFEKPLAGMDGFFDVPDKQIDKHQHYLPSTHDLLTTPEKIICNAPFLVDSCHDEASKDESSKDDAKSSIAAICGPSEDSSTLIDSSDCLHSILIPEESFPSGGGLPHCEAFTDSISSSLENCAIRQYKSKNSLREPIQQVKLKHLKFEGKSCTPLLEKSLSPPLEKCTGIAYSSQSNNPQSASTALIEKCISKENLFHSNQISSGNGFREDLDGYAHLDENTSHQNIQSSHPSSNFKVEPATNYLIGIDETDADDPSPLSGEAARDVSKGNEGGPLTKIIGNCEKLFSPRKQSLRQAKKRIVSADEKVKLEQPEELSGGASKQIKRKGATKARKFSLT